MIIAMFFEMNLSPGSVPALWSMLAHAALIVEFPLLHSVLLMPFGGKLLSKLTLEYRGKTLATTTCAIIAPVHLLALYALWTPSGIIWW